MSSVQAAPANANSHTQVQTNNVAVTNSGKRVSSNRSVNVSNNSSQSVSSGSATNPMDVSSSLDLPSAQELFPSVP